MDWSKTISPQEIQEMPLNLKESLIGTYNDFLFGQGFETKIVEKNDQLYVESPFFEFFKGQKDRKLIYLKSGLFKIVDYPNLLKFNLDEGKPSSVILTRNNLNLEIALNKKGN